MIKKNLMLTLLLMLTFSAVYAQDKALEISETGVVKVEKKITDSKGTTYDPLPVGTILMFSGQNWEDNVTLPGWYACTAENESTPINSVLIPNLENTFIMGTNTNDIKVTDTRTGGKNELTKDEMPKHDHSFDHSHPRAYGATHGSNDGNHGHTSKLPIGLDGNTSTAPYAIPDSGANTNDWWKTYSNVNPSNHGHSVYVDIPYTSGKTTSSSGNGIGSGKENKMDNRPQYYTVIYIIKVSN